MSTKTTSFSGYSKWMCFALAALMLSGAGVLIYRLKNQQKFEEPGVKVGAVPLYDTNNVVIADQSVLLPEVVTNATSKPGLISNAELTELPKDTTFGRRIYKFADGLEVQMSAVLMKTDRSSIHQPQYCLVGQGWNIDKTEVAPVRIERPFPYELSTMKLTTSIWGKDSQGQPTRLNGLYVYWFVAKDKLALNQFDRTWSMFKTSLKEGTLERWAYVSCFAVCNPGHEDETFDRIKALISASVPEFQLASGTPLHLQ